MNNISFQNIGKLISKFFIERWKIEMFILLAFFLASFATNYLWRMNGSGLSPLGIIAIITTLIIFASSIFSDLWSKTSSVLYLSLPTNTLDKVSANIIISHFIRPLTFSTAGLLGYLISFPIPPFMNRSSYHPSLSDVWSEITTRLDVLDVFSIITGLMLAYSIFMFGSVYFKRAAFLKTLLSIFVFLTALALLNVGVVFFIEYLYESGIISFSTFTENSTINMALFKGILILIFSVLTMFFWLLSYFRLKETEV